MSEANELLKRVLTELPRSALPGPPHDQDRYARVFQGIEDYFASGRADHADRAVRIYGKERIMHHGQPE